MERFGGAASSAAGPSQFETEARQQRWPPRKMGFVILHPQISQFLQTLAIYLK
jgi:hypothetical protein